MDMNDGKGEEGFVDPPPPPLRRGDPPGFVAEASILRVRILRHNSTILITPRGRQTTSRFDVPWMLCEARITGDNEATKSLSEGGGEARKRNSVSKSTLIKRSFPRTPPPSLTSLLPAVIAITTRCPDSGPGTTFLIVRKIPLTPLATVRLRVHCYRPPAGKGGGDRKTLESRYIWRFPRGPFWWEKQENNEARTGQGRLRGSHVTPPPERMDGA
ncbi:hypothetical protein LZ31DRAFT_102108 [Colletotrichum somersetense]|nr:hypothetical protein LZ31DRAFT_102108 [Colletotrichum somersetense]